MNAPDSRLAAAPAMAPLARMKRQSREIANGLVSRSLVHNTCWEDSAVGRQALQPGPADTVLVITSAGCNALELALLGPRRIHAIDVNPRQTALLELKLAGIRRLEFDDYFLIFGDGYHPRFRDLYRQCLRGDLSDYSRGYWDRYVSWFTSRHGSFYYHGLAGFVGRGFSSYFRSRPQLASSVLELFSCETVEAQRRIYDGRVSAELWTPTMYRALHRQLVLSLIGVPRMQRYLVPAQHPGGVGGFVRDAIDHVFRHLPAASNHFWRVNLHGSYTRKSCPDYLKPEGFMALKNGLAERIEPHTSTVREFLRDCEEPISRFSLFDYMDWISIFCPNELAAEWEAIIARAAPGGRILLSSTQARPAYLDQIRLGAGHRRLSDALHFDHQLATQLQTLDRVHAYPGLMVAELRR